MNHEHQQEFPNLIIGLGNPGNRYQDNRHNVGFKVVEALAAKLNLTFSAEDSSYLSTPFSSDSHGLVLVKPMTYMNLSGEAVSAWLERHNLEPEPSRVLVVCDDLALPLGSLRLRGKGSSGGQNGLASIIQHLATEVFCRLRLGIDGTEGEIDPAQWPDYVTADFAEKEAETASEMMDRAIPALECWLEMGLEQAASRHNRRPKTETDQ